MIVLSSYKKSPKKKSEKVKLVPRNVNKSTKDIWRERKPLSVLFH